MLFHLVCYVCIICTRRQIRVNKVIVHKNFTDSANDIAILRLGKKDLDIIKHLTSVKHLIDNQLIEKRVDLSVFRPACLPDIGESFVDQNGHVYGEQRQPRLCQPIKTIFSVLLPLYLRLGRHWSGRDLHGQAARDCSSNRFNQQLF